MIHKALKDICKISNDESINMENYLDAINYIDNLYHLESVLKRHVSIRQLSFLPSFKGKYLCERLGITSDPEENVMKVFRVTSDVFRVDDELTQKITDEMQDFCNKITVVDNMIIFILK